MNKEQLIYIADDDRNIRQAIKTFLENEGYRVEDFETGDMVMEAFKKCPCDLMILDVMMPGTDGFEVCRQFPKSLTIFFQHAYCFFILTFR